MKTNPNDSVYNSEQAPQDGLTKREYFAAMALQGLLANPNGGTSRSGQKIFEPHRLSELACIHADTLINELNEENP